MFVIGTAGHVDHGKSVLVKALTGIDPDRLAEEKERGLTIDLGFAWLTLPSGREVSIVDVPGHERFVKNMLAGVGGIDLALLIVAVDEGVMPQTKEHLAILNLLEVKSGILVATKKDLVDEEWLQLVKSDIADAVKNTTFAKAPMVVVSAQNGDGLPQLLDVIDKMLESTAQKEDMGRPRLPIDRVFTMSGFGTVVTGTLIDGSLSVGQEVEVVPKGLKSRIRGLQIHKTKTESVGPGNRVAVNLVGLSTSDLDRGDVLTMAGWLRPTSRCDVKMRTVADLPRPVKHNAKVIFYTASSETPAKVRFLDRDVVGADEEVWAQIKLENHVALVKGDFFIVRASWGTLGGGRIVDTYARRHRRFHKPIMDGLAALDKGGTHEALLKLLDRGGVWEMDKLIARSGVVPEKAKESIKALTLDNRILVLSDMVLFSDLSWSQFKGKTREIVGQYHKQYPLRLGLPKENLKSRLKLSNKVFGSILPQIIEEGIVVDDGAVLHLPEHEIILSDVQQKSVDLFLESLEANPYAPVLDSIPDNELLNLLFEQGKAVKVSDSVIFSPQAYHEMVQKITDYMKSKGKITVAKVRDLLATSRKYALAFMEYMDEQKITRRVGDERVLRAGS
ncbi:selenocysteine-specific translation elongation factor [Chloroflexota bacterium]